MSSRAYKGLRDRYGPPAGSPALQRRDRELARVEINVAGADRERFAYRWALTHLLRPARLSKVARDPDPALLAHGHQLGGEPSPRVPDSFVLLVRCPLTPLGP